MDLYQAIRSYASQPLTHQLIVSLLKGYKRPNDKVHALLNEGVLESVKKGLYIAGPAIKTAKPEPFLLANHILGPSYVSLDTALSYHGWIPERVYEVASMTTKASRKFTTPLGVFTYTHLSLPYYAFGIRQIQLADEQYAMMATPEKALFDKIITTSGLILRSHTQVLNYLLEDLRINEDLLRECDLQNMSQWVQDASKTESLSILVKTLKDL
ncbi:MAG: type IV toxin-antitoxin system AbiEi family antitoxin domain-containing protein [Daejeonella sp.]